MGVGREGSGEEEAWKSVGGVGVGVDDSGGEKGK